MKQPPVTKREAMKFGTCLLVKLRLVGPEPGLYYMIINIHCTYIQADGRPVNRISLYSKACRVLNEK